MLNHLFILLLSNALTSRRDKSILFSRVVILALISTSFSALNNLFIQCLGKGIAIYGGLLNITSFTQTFNIFIFLINAVILTLTAFYPRKVYVKEHSSLNSLLFNKLIYNKKTISKLFKVALILIGWDLFMIILSIFMPLYFLTGLIIFNISLFMWVYINLSPLFRHKHPLIYKWLNAICIIICISLFLVLTAVLGFNLLSIVYKVLMQGLNSCNASSSKAAGSSGGGDNGPGGNGRKPYSAEDRFNNKKEKKDKKKEKFIQKETNREAEQARRAEKERIRAEQERIRVETFERRLEQIRSTRQDSANVAYTRIVGKKNHLPGEIVREIRKEYLKAACSCHTGAEPICHICWTHRR